MTTTSDAVITLRTPEVLEFRKRSCERKRWFARRIDAEKVNKHGQRVYHCRFCAGYHLTSLDDEHEFESFKKKAELYVRLSKEGGHGCQP